MERPDFINKADISPIISGHLKTLANARTGKPSTGDWAFFFGLPLAAGLALVALRFHFRTDAVSGFLSAFSILTGLLLNLLVFVFSLTTSAQKEQQLRRRILKEVFTNVCYCIILAISVVATALVDLGYMRSQAGATTGLISTFVLSAFTFNFVLTLFMVMKRMYRLISTEFDSKPSSSKAA